MKRFAWIALLAATAFAQKLTSPKTIVRREMDFSACDIVSIEGKIESLHVDSGVFHAYWFKKYRDMSTLHITCETEAR